MKIKHIIVALLATPLLGMAAPHLELVGGDRLELGGFRQQDPQTRSVWIKNTGDEPLEIDRIFSGCSCTKTRMDRSPIAPGDSTEMTVIYNGEGRSPGPVRRSLRIISNADNPITILYINGTITPQFKR